MTHSIRMLSTIALAALTLTACSAAEADAPRDDLVFVLGAHANAPQATAAEVAQLLEESIDAEGDRVSIISADGVPRLVYSTELTDLSGFSRDRRDEIEDAIAAVKTHLTTTAADDPEVDLVEAIALARAQFRTGTKRTLMILDPGLQTTGALNMTDGRLYAGADVLMTHLEEHGAIADLSGVDVRMPRLGSVEGAQPALTEDARRTLTEIWTAYFTAASASSVDLEPSGRVALPPTADLPPVTPVAIERPGPVAAGCSQLLGAGTIGFDEGSAVPIDAVAARATVAEVHAALGGCPGAYTVAGSASSEGDASENLDLSEDRARAIAAILADVSGVSASDIHVTAWGIEWPCRQQDLDADGRLILDAAVYNRTVIVTKGEASC